MLIATRFKRPKAPITIDGETYHFLPRDPSNPESEHVCEVANKAHVGRLLGIPEGYYLPDDDPAPATPAPRPVAQVPSSETTPAGDDSTPPPPVPPTDAVAIAPLDDDQREAAENINGLSWQKLKAEIGKGGIPALVLHEALRIEEAKPEEDQRATTIKILKQAIEAG
ncbi:MAG: hypothetical protein ACREO4_06160 [Lysobacter sp.]